MRRRLLSALLGGTVGLALVVGCGGAESESQLADKPIVRPTLDPSRPTTTPISLPTPVVKDEPKLRTRGIITEISDTSLTSRDIDGQELTMKPGLELEFSLDQLKELHHKRAALPSSIRRVATTPSW